MRVDLIPEAHQAGSERRDLRELTCGRLRMVHDRSRLQSGLWGVAIKYNIGISGDDWRYLPELQGKLVRQLPSAASLQAELLIGQVSLLCRLEPERIRRGSDSVPPDASGGHWLFGRF